jgi:hypothetical protein
MDKLRGKVFSKFLGLLCRRSDYVKVQIGDELGGGIREHLSPRGIPAYRPGNCSIFSGWHVEWHHRFFVVFIASRAR